jgi:Mannosyltransferase (PIG-V)
VSIGSSALVQGRSRARYERFGLQGWTAIVLSRLLVLGSGLVGALAVARRHGWQAFDVHHFSSSLGPVGNALGATVVRWDAIHYIYIAQSGYKEVQDTVFFPFYPLLIKVGALIVRSDVIAGVIISLVSFVIALMLLHRLAREELDIRAADATIWLLAFAPMSLFFSAIYTESLFLALSVGALYAARHEKWWIACCLAALAALTRVPGVLLIAPIAIFYWQSPPHVRRAKPLQVLWLALPAVALAAFLAYMQKQGFGWSAPIKNQTGHAHEHTFAGPIWTVVHGFRDGVSGIAHIIGGSASVTNGFSSSLSNSAENFMLMIVLLICIATLVLAWFRLPRAYAVYSLLILLECLWSPVNYRPLMSLDRYSLVIFPLWMAAASWLSERRLVGSVVVVSAVMLSFFSICIAAWAFVA